MHVRTPGFYRDYPSAFFGPYHGWFRDMGYPTLDLEKDDTGEWWIVEVLNGGYIPSETPFRTILSGMKNLELNFSNVMALVKSIDPQRKEFWERERLKSFQAELDFDAKERHQDDIIDRMASIIMKSDDMKERIARNGIREISPIRIWNRHHFKHV